MKLLLKKIICWFLRHEVITLEQNYSLVKVKCTRCNQHFCGRIGDTKMLPWDADFEDVFRMKKREITDL